MLGKTNAYSIFFRVFLFTWVAIGTAAPSRAEPVVVAILDTPLDYSHPRLKHFIDRKLLRELGWYRLNQELRGEYSRRISPDLFHALKNYSNSEAALEEGSYSQESQEHHWKIQNLYSKHLVNEEASRQLDHVNSYLHGTQVAGVVTYSYSRGIRLINFSFAPTAEFFEFEWDQEKHRESLRQDNALLTEGFKKAKVRVVNYSYGASYYENLEFAKKSSSFFGRTFGLPWLKKNVLIYSQIQQEEQRQLFRDNPDTLFVVAAGNEAMDLSEHPSTSGVQEPNVLIVGATELLADGGIELVSYSNFSADFVQIAAPGTGVKGAMVGGGSLHSNGTSVATPLVTNRIISILQENPHLKPQEAIQSFLKKYAYQLESLEGLVRDGNYLRVEFRGKKMRFVSNDEPTCNEVINLSR